MVEPWTYSSSAKVTCLRLSRSSAVNPDASTPRRFAGSSAEKALFSFSGFRFRLVDVRVIRGGG